MADRTILDLADRLTPGMRDAFLAAVDNMKADTDVTAFIRALEEGDVEAALRFLAVSAQQMEPLRRAIEVAFVGGGYWSSDRIARSAAREGLRVVARFEGRNVRAEAILSELSSRRIVEIESDQREGVRGYLTRQMEAGSNPRRVGLDIVGRINRKTGRREGGLIGLHSGQIEWVERAQAELRSGDTDALRHYLTRAKRDRRFDAIVRRAIRDGKPVSVADTQKMAKAYAARLLKQRGETIARTETLASIHAAQDESLRQMVDSGRVSASQVTRTWDSAEDRATRPSHRAMDDQARGLNEPFVSPVTQARLWFPGDGSLGAGADETINCRCRVVVKIDWIAGLQRGD